ncbi:hypothetical protein [Pedobacter steynii]
MDRNYFGLTDTGKVRDNNEDTFIAETTTANDLVIACVIDGVGGYSGGRDCFGDCQTINFTTPEQSA